MLPPSGTRSKIEKGRRDELRDEGGGMRDENKTFKTMSSFVHSSFIPPPSSL
jgi:hypothetical protein